MSNPSGREAIVRVKKEKFEAEVAEFVRTHREALLAPVVLARQDEVDRATDLSAQAATLVREFLDDAYPGTDKALTSLFTFYRERVKPAVCLPVCQALLEHRRAHQGPGFPHVAHCLHDMAGLHEQMGDHEKADAVNAEATAILARAKLDPELKAWCFRIGDIRILDAAHSQRFETAKAILETRRQELGDKHPAVAYALLDLAEITGDENHSREAQSILAAANANPGYADIATGLAHEAEVRAGERFIAELEKTLLESKLRVAEKEAAALKNLLDQELDELASLLKEAQPPAARTIPNPTPGSAAPVSPKPWWQFWK
jgi:hypothetical protein